MSSNVGAALIDSLMRCLPPAAGESAHLSRVVQAMADALEQGNLGLDLEGDPPEGIEPEHWPAAVLATLASSGWMVQAEALDRHPEAPIVQDGSCLRWRRWHQHLQSCLERLLDLGCSPLDPPAADSMLASARQRSEQAGLDSSQCAAVTALLQRRMVLLTGGPGTGKTSTVVQMLAAALHLNPQLRIQLAAPTGKAAARLGEAVFSGCQALQPALAAQLQQLPSTTLHRLLEARADHRFRRNHRLPLELDLLVVDEVSMVDLPLMTALLEALPSRGQLVLVGDGHQLPPVGPGTVLQELSQPERLRQLGQAAVELRTTYRNEGAIAELANHLRQRSAASGPPLMDWLRPYLQQLGGSDNVQWRQAPLSQVPIAILEPLQRHQQQLSALAGQLTWKNGTPDPQGCDQLLQELEQLIALSPIRLGPWGVEALHRALLGPVAKEPLHRWPLGTPVLNRHNRPEQGLANGDIGVVVKHDEQRWVLMAGRRLLHPARLGAAEPALALTVHKAQGSQYGTVLLVLPPSRNSDPRLLYTGLTRARRQAVLITPLEAPPGHPSEPA
jgi:exodeoxyribonuclease V alpha subunit